MGRFALCVAAPHKLNMLHPLVADLCTQMYLLTFDLELKSGGNSEWPVARVASEIGPELEQWRRHYTLSALSMVGRIKVSRYSSSSRRLEYPVVVFIPNNAHHMFHLFMQPRQLTCTLSPWTYWEGKYAVIIEVICTVFNRIYVVYCAVSLFHRCWQMNSDSPKGFRRDVSQCCNF